jgi:outer membrane murein-binding lipoprotein Lpp
VLDYLMTGDELIRDAARAAARDAARAAARADFAALVFECFDGPLQRAQEQQ